MSIAGAIGHIFSTRARRAHDRYMREIEAVERITVASLEAVSAEDLAEQLAAEKIRHADTQRRLQATLEALDKARMENGALKEAEADRRIADLLREDLSAQNKQDDLNGSR